MTIIVIWMYIIVAVLPVAVLVFLKIILDIVSRVLSKPSFLGKRLVIILIVLSWVTMSFVGFETFFPYLPEIGVLGIASLAIMTLYIAIKEGVIKLV